MSKKIKLERAKNAKRNIVMALAHKLVSIILPFLVRTILIKKIGVDYLGVNSLFASILSILNITEMGFSSAVVYSMYKPIADNDQETICSLLYFYRKIYRFIGSVVLVIGILLIPFLDKFIHGSYPENINLTLLYLIYLCNTVLGYFMYSYLSSVIVAYQREDIISCIGIVISILLNGTQILMILISKNYYVYSILFPVFTIVNNLLIAVIVHRIYPQYRCEGALSKDILHDIKVRVTGLLISKICNTSRNAFDSIYISAFLGLTVTVIYNNYYYIINAITVILNIISHSILGGVGNSVVLETVEKNYEDMNKMNFIYMWISGWFTVCLLCLIQPFMQIWMGKDLMFPLSVVCLLCIYFYVLKMGDVRTVYVQVNGLWWENRFRSIIEAIGNIVLNYFLGKKFGVHGIIIATILTIFLINFGYGSTILFKHYFKEQNVKEYYRKHFHYMLVTGIVALGTYYLCQLVDIGNWSTIIVRLIICLIVPNIGYVFFYRKMEIFEKSIKWGIAILKR